MGFERYVALGDSFTEGVGDPDPLRPNGLRGWADLVAEQLARGGGEFGYANLAIRGRLLRPIIDQQVDAAVAMHPDLVTIYAGGNNLMRPKVDFDGLAADYDEAVGKLAGTGARVLMWTAYDGSWAPVFGALRGRWAVYNELVREIADRHGATIVDFWRFTEYRDLRMWDFDRLHLSAAGHHAMAIRVLDLLGVPHTLGPVVFDEAPVISRAAQRADDRRWMREFLAPWVVRRLRGVSSGDGISPKRPVLAPVVPATV